MIRTFRHQRAVWASLGLAATVAACTDGTTPTNVLAPSTLAFAAGAGKGQFEDFTPIPASADASRTGDAVWVPLDREAVQVNSDAAAIAAGATGWGRPEDIEISTSGGSTKGGNVMYVTSTSEDLVLRTELNGDKAYVSNFMQEGVNVSGLNNPDNLALDNQGNVYVIEDNGPGDIFIARVRTGNERVAQDVALFASLSDCAAEPTGMYFDRSGKTAWVHVQHAGGTLRNDLFMAIAKE